MYEKIVVITEGIKGQKLGQMIKLHLGERYNIECLTSWMIGKGLDAALIILIVNHVSHLTIDAVETIHLQFKKIPILLISGQTDPQKRICEKVKVIGKGVDEYLTDTQTLEEIEASAKALIRRNLLKEHGDVISVGRDFKINPVCREIIVEGKRIDLTKKEFDIVYYLALNANKAVSYKELYEGVWKKEYLCDDKNIMAHIHRIRKKLKKDPKNPEYIRSVYGVGYCFVDSKYQKKVGDIQYIEKEEFT